MTGITFENSSLDNFNNPFNKDCIQKVWFYCYRDSFDGQIKYTASVEFKNNNTEGKQSFKAPDFKTLLKQVDDFIKNL